MPQDQSVSDNTVKAFLAIPDDQKRTALGRMSPEAKQALYGAIQARQGNQVENTLSKATSVSAQPKPFSKEWFTQGLWRAGAGAADIAPAAGATVGGLIGSGGGPLGAVGGAGFGGGGGEAAKQLMRRALGFPDVPQTSGEAAQGIAKEAGLQGLIQGTTELVPPLGGPLSRAAERQYERALGPTTQVNKAITRDISPELIRRGEVGSLPGLEKKAGEEISRLSPQLGAQYAGTTVKNAGVKVWQDLQALKQTYMPGGVVAQPQAVKAIEGVQDIIRQYGTDISDTNLRRLRQIFEQIPGERGAYSGVDLPTNYTLKAQEQAADSIRGILNSNPDIGALNKEISFWLDVQRVTRATELRRVGQAGGLVRTLLPLGTGIAGGLAKGETTGLEAAGVTLLTTLAWDAIRSPAWRTASAVVKDRFAQAIAYGELGQAAALGARLTRAAATSDQGDRRTGSEQ